MSAEVVAGCDPYSMPSQDCIVLETRARLGSEVDRNL